MPEPTKLSENLYLFLLGSQLSLIFNESHFNEPGLNYFIILLNILVICINEIAALWMVSPVLSPVLKYPTDIVLVSHVLLKDLNNQGIDRTPFACSVMFNTEMLASDLLGPLGSMDPWIRFCSSYRFSSEWDLEIRGLAVPWAIPKQFLHCGGVHCSSTGHYYLWGVLLPPGSCAG